MKTSKEWSFEFINQGMMLAPLKGNEPTAAMAIVEQIQREACQQGMTEAAEIVKGEGMMMANNFVLAEAIVAASNNL